MRFIVGLALGLGLAFWGLALTAEAAGRHPRAVLRHRRHHRPRRIPRLAGPTPLQQQFLFGFSQVGEGGLDDTRTAALAAGAGANVMRSDIHWQAFEALGPDAAFWADYDRLHAAMAAAGVRMLWVIGTTPVRFADTADGSCTTGAPCWDPPTEAHIADLARFAQLVAQRYPDSAGIEVWNEPNVHWFWPGHIDVARYTQMLKAVYTAVKQVDPQMIVTTGGIDGDCANSQDTSTDQTLATFLAGIYANGGKGYFDAISFHPYPVVSDPNACYRFTLNEVRAVRDANGDANTPLWMSEFGLTTGPPSAAADHFSEARQASLIDFYYKDVQAMPDVKAFIVHGLTDPSLLTDPDWGFGVVRSDFSLRPAYCTLAIDRGLPSPGNCSAQSSIWDGL